MTYVEEILRLKTEGNNNSILVGQWEYDKKLLPSALGAVALMFPHYSLHDESHSLSIIDNITRIIGKEIISELSGTDLWLLLEAAYCHDLGMIVTAEKIEKVFKDGSFLEYYKKVSLDPSNPLYKYCQYFEVKDGKLVITSLSNLLDVHDATKFLLSGFFRLQHGRNSKLAVLNPVDEIAISSPRAIIPQRLYCLLGDICMAHADNFDEVISLPQVEVGLGLDETHPRFIASLLRLGDVLDIDNPRFSETLIKTIKALPKDSELHKEKHMSIRHLRIDTKKIEIIACCSNPKIAQVTQEWFNWISNEFKTQSLKWNDIVPVGLKCYLPNINYLQTDIEGYITTNKNFKDCFTIDTPKALELLQGKNFYASKFDAIRELLQNSVDSTLLKYFIDNAEGNLPTSPENLYNLAKAGYCIDVNIEERDSSVFVSIKDRGIGLSSKRLSYLTHTGSSSKDVEKRLTIDKMPEWMHPSGIFGIGFQSIFLLTPKVEIKTKDYATDEKMALELYSPNSDMGGEIFMRKINTRLNYGFVLEFEIKSEMFEVTNNDPFNAVPASSNIELIKSKVRTYAQSSMIPINLNGIIIERTQYDYYDENTKIELKFGPLTIKDSRNTSESRYRNALVGLNSASKLFVHPGVNLHFGEAKSLLTLNRDNISSSKVASVDNAITNTIINYINSPSFNVKGYSGEQQLMFSFFVKYYKLDDRISTSLPKIDDFAFSLGGDNITIREILSCKNVRYLTTSNNLFTIKRESSDTITVELNSFVLLQLSFFYEYAMFIFDMLSKNKTCSFCNKFILTNNFLSREYIFTDDNNIETELSISDIRNNCRISEKRMFIYNMKGYEALVIPASYEDSTIDHETDVIVKNIFRFKKILSPFITVDGKARDCRNENFYQYVSKANGHSMSEIRQTYDLFVNDCRKNGLVFE